MANQVEKNLKLVRTKLTLAAKCEHRAQLAKSAAKRKKYLYDAERHRRIASQLSGT